MLERTLVFVDTSYLLASFYNSWETGARAQLEIDLPDVVHVLGEMIENQLHQPIHRQLWYDGIPDSGPHRYQRALRTCDGVQLRAGQLIEWGERRTQKAVDTRLVADMVLAAVDQQCSDIVLVSGDADMIPGVSEASRRGVRVHLYGFGWDSMSSALRHHCDTTTILDPREDFHDSMHLEVLEGPVPPVVREPAAGSEDDDGDSVPGDATTGDQPPSTSPERPEAPATPTAADQEAQGTACAESAGASIADAAPAATGADASASGASDAADSSGAAASGAASAEAGKHEKAKDAGASGEAPKETGPEGKEQAEQQGPEAQAQQASAAGADGAAAGAGEAPATAATHPKTPAPDADSAVERDLAGEAKPKPKPRPKPSMMAPKRRLRSRYVPLPNEVWASAGFQTPFDVGQQYATWWYENAATGEQRDQAHMLSGGGLPPEVDRPLLQFACETLHEYTLSDKQRVNLRDGFHAGIRGLLINVRRQN